MVGFWCLLIPLAGFATIGKKPLLLWTSVSLSEKWGGQQHYSSPWVERNPTGTQVTGTAPNREEVQQEMSTISMEEHGTCGSGQDAVGF